MLHGKGKNIISFCRIQEMFFAIDRRGMSLMGKGNRFWVFAMVFISVQAYGSEIDTFTGSCEPLPDLSFHLNEKVMEGLKEAAINANRMSRLRYYRDVYPFRGTAGTDYCSLAALQSEIRKRFARALEGQLETYLNELPPSAAARIDFDHSIYRDFTVEETPTLAGLKKMGAVVRMGPYRVGADKFGHFFSEGWSYFIRVQENKGNIDEALLFGEMSESIYFGALTTGVFSFADLAANFNGLRFWNRVAGDHPDPLFPEKEVKPYFRCKNSQWVLEADFDWREYVDPAWDERFNQSLFRNQMLLEKVSKRIDSLKEEPSGCLCDLMDQEEDVAMLMLRKYGRYGPRLLNISGHDTLPEELFPSTLIRQFFHRDIQHPRTERENAIVSFFRSYRDKMTLAAEQKQGE
jgi:hypothetical protein